MQYERNIPRDCKLLEQDQVGGKEGRKRDNLPGNGGGLRDLHGNQIERSHHQPHRKHPPDFNGQEIENLRQPTGEDRQDREGNGRTGQENLPRWQHQGSDQISTTAGRTENCGNRQEIDVPRR